MTATTAQDTPSEPSEAADRAAQAARRTRRGARLLALVTAGALTLGAAAYESKHDDDHGPSSASPAAEP
ncbi:hypothetical protein P8605_49840, partial [Streptomyces sp. T-3]|nr:hypothetical protein [Streptomyces sp. T-3]